MIEKAFETSRGSIHYWVDIADTQLPWIVMLPGLTADHHLFDAQLDHFRNKANLLTWDAPGHGASRPWTGGLALDSQACLLHQILETEGIEKPVLIGQSMGGYVSQAFLELFPEGASALVSIDSAPLKRRYYAPWETASLKHTLGMYKCIPWNMLVKWTATGCSETPHGKQYMLDLANSYGRKAFQELSAEGYKQLALAIESDKPYEIPCPLLVLCGEKDAAGFTKKYNQDWQKNEGVNLVWVPNAGHNSNMDAPAFANEHIEKFLSQLGLLTNVTITSMKTVGIISDTHGKLPARAFTAMDGCDLIIHAGDICDPNILCDLQTLAPVRAVLGNNDRDEYGPDVCRFANFEFEGVRFLVAHYPRHVKGLKTGSRALAPGDPLPDVSIHGHTHIPVIETGAEASPAKLLVCPGSVSRPRGEFPASIAKIEIEDGQVKNAWVEDLHGIVFMRL